MKRFVMPKPLVILDLSVETERRLLDAIARRHSGKSPAWRALAMHRTGDRLFEVAEWLCADARATERRYNVVEWHSDAGGLGMRWQKRRLSRQGAMRVFRRLIQASAHHQLAVFPALTAMSA